MAEKKCICQICTCSEKLHKCKYEPGEETLKKAAEAHCRRCGCKKKTKPYVPMGPMETTTTYNSEYQPKLQEAPPCRKQNNQYNRPAAPMEGSTTYNADFTSKPTEPPPCCKKPNNYRPMGDMLLETTYNGEFREKVLPEQRPCTKPAGYLRPMGPMNLDTTYNSDYTQKPMDLGFEPCCPCCDPRSEGYVAAGEENGHMMFVKRG
ncbi:hypothetical protein BOX15_Mlig022832g3 [Macrostomum lignano]|uniref:Uncharacterized protein n=1 Tax=Macrostomum lignano TaxID=282301 RepID=A0A267DQG2_9PLAT|nr:hypothetical protein BOX15_Mlig022832g2 [Macrostomum lignano]PAA60174.1 hypothetical protein BOX15_Mlig022832g1 [Macrostomum lignano]PAA81166.1 hypothetical protein BOX15_Mlig022832g3 [Macrostomum lignano]